MKLLNWFARRSTTNTATKTFRTTLSLNQLESREVPASLKSNFNPVAAAHANPNAAAHANARSAIVAPATTQTATIGGYAFFDFNENGAINDGDGAAPSYIITLTINGTEYFATTDPDGRFSFGSFTFTPGTTYTLSSPQMVGLPQTNVLTAGTIDVNIGIQGE